MFFGPYNYLANPYYRPPHFTAPEITCVHLLHYALSLAYIFTYPAVQAGCPTFIILFIIKSLMPKGATRDYIGSYCLQKNLFGLGIKDVIDEGLVVDKNGWLGLTTKGRLLLEIFIFIRKIFGLPIGLG